VKLYEFASHILKKGDLSSKLISSNDIVWDEREEWSSERYERPSRNSEISFSEQQVKFPGKGSLKEPLQRGKALHFFANHELLAIEMMAQALLLFPQLSFAQRKSLVMTISEEQKHFSMYLSRMQELGVSFGDYPLNQFFWSFMADIETPDQFYSVISLTFEQANLDFASYYMELFKELGDLKTHAILKEVYEDEIKHVARGRSELLKNVTGPEELWHHYCESLPSNLTPARAKGIHFDDEARKKSGLPHEFISSLKTYKNSFSVTNRKEWKE
jgi:uncharacterized ferritin-like protein (DUF455 family)